MLCPEPTIKREGPGPLYKYRGLCSFGLPFAHRICFCAVGCCFWLTASGRAPPGRQGSADNFVSIAAEFGMFYKLKLFFVVGS